MTSPDTHHSESPSSRRSEKKRREQPDSSIKETLESIIIAFILAFVFRAFVVEAFVIPTGSMAPTLLGEHVQLTDPETGYTFDASYRDTFRTADGGEQPFAIQGQVTRQRGGERVRFDPLTAEAPMSGGRIHEPRLATRAGDRILVLKYLYAIHEPSRWDVVVFKNPENPTQNYIKRLIGLPNERLWLARGNVYTASPEGNDWRIQRKPTDVQRTVWQPIYHSRYVPLDTPAEPTASPGPWKPITPDRWSFTHQGRRMHYRPTANEPASGGDGLRFAFSDRSARDFYAYNVLTRAEPENLIEDLRVSMKVRPEAGGAALRPELRTEHFEVRAVVRDGEPPVLQMRRRDAVGRAAGRWVTVGPDGGEPVELPDGRWTRVAFWYVDHRLALWIDGERVAKHDIPVVLNGGEAGVDAPFVIDLAEISVDGADQPRPITTAPEVTVGVSGAAMVLSEVNLDRDLYYTRGQGRAVTSPFLLQADEFFCLGDNSPQSKDSRLWSNPNPWVAYQTPGHGPDGVRAGVVPRKLMIGKAFFVYFPAMLRLEKDDTFGIIPNFGDMRFIR